MTPSAAPMHQTVDDRVRRLVALHFDPDAGSRYWVRRAAELGLSPQRDLQSEADLLRLGPMDASALADRPVEDFVPARVLAGGRQHLLTAETGGTSGRPKFAIHRRDEFLQAFVAPFVAAADRCGFPRGLNWLFLGPTGPHVIGQAARACAEAMGSMGPFCVDFDPRWARSLVEGSFSRTRYLQHIEEQALRVLDSQEIGVLFATPPVLASLGAKVPPERRSGIRGIHFGGMPVSAQLRAELAELFPSAIMLSGYGNTLFGMMPELAYDPSAGIDYFPHGLRLLVRLVEMGTAGEGDRLGRLVPPGQRGQVVVTRLDEAQLIVNMFERDSALRLPPRDDAGPDFAREGLRDVQPIVVERTKPPGGLY